MDVLLELEAQIQGAKSATARRNVGTIREIADGVAKVDGLTDAMLNEMLDLGEGITGLALNWRNTKSALSSSATILAFARATRSEPQASFFRFRLERACSVVW